VRRRRRHGGALLAALAYGVAAFAVYQLVVLALGHDAAPATGVEKAVASAPPVQAELGTSAPRQLLALRAVASRVQQSVYTLRVDGATRGSAFAGWLYRGKISFLLTARSAVDGVGGKIFVKRARQSLPARVVRADEASGLALLRVNTALDRPLWQRAGKRAALKEGASAVVVPAGTSGAFGHGSLAKGHDSFSLPVGGGSRYLGAPVLDDDGRLAGIVVELTPLGGSRIVSLADACRRIRACG